MKKLFKLRLFFYITIPISLFLVFFIVGNHQVAKAICPPVHINTLIVDSNPVAPGASFTVRWTMSFMTGTYGARSESLTQTPPGNQVYQESVRSGDSFVNYQYTVTAGITETTTFTLNATNCDSGESDTKDLIVTVTTPTPTPPLCYQVDTIQCQVNVGGGFCTEPTQQYYQTTCTPVTYSGCGGGVDCTSNQGVNCTPVAASFCNATPTPTPTPTPILGCTNPNATNYNSGATQDDGSCVFAKPKLDLTKIQSILSYPTNSDGFGVMNVQNQKTTSMNWTGTSNNAWVTNLTNGVAGGSGLGNGGTSTGNFSVNPAQALIGTNNGSITETCSANSLDSNGNATGCEPSNQTKTLGVQYTVPGPSVTISANPPGPVVAGTPVTLTWAGTNCNANSPVSSSNFGAGNTCSGSKVVTPVSPSSTYTITVQGLSDVDNSPNNFATASTTVNVTLPDTPVVTLQGRTGNNAYSSGPISITSGSNVDLKWTISHETATSCTASNGWSGSKASATGDNFATPAKNNITSGTTFTITCSNAGGDSVPASLEVRILTVSLNASPGSGNAPLNSVSLTATPAGTVSGPTYRYFFDCTNDGSNELDSGNIATNPYTASNLCNYPTSGTYTAKVTVWHDQGVATGTTTTITVSIPPNGGPSASNVTAIEPDYCVSGPAATITWDYSDPENDPESAFQVQVSNTGSFVSPVFDSGKISGSSTAYFVNSLEFNTTYKARVKVWDSHDAPSNWSSPSSSWKTPKHAYPDLVSSGAQLTWTPASPKANNPVNFTDHTIFNDGSAQHSWAWLFGDNGSSTVQNPSHTYSSNGSYNVTETATDKDGFACSLSKLLNVQRSIPIWKEISPGQ